MSTSKKMAALHMAAVIVMANLTACSSVNTAKDIPNMTTGDVTIFIPRTYDECIMLAAECYGKQDWETALTCYQAAKNLDDGQEEVYRGLSDVYLQMDDVMQALAILDEGIEKCGDKHGVDLGGQNTPGQSMLSQRKEYVLSGMAAVRTQFAKTEYDEDGSILSGRTLECDVNGNEIKEIRFGEGGEISYVVECQYDEAGNKTEYKGISYESDGSSTLSAHWTWAYDVDGREIEFVSYDADGKIETRTASAYDAAGNVIKDEEYDEHGNCTERIITDYDEHGNQIKRTCYDSRGRVRFWYEKEYDENDKEIKYVYYKNAASISFSYEREYDENGNLIKTVHYKDAETLDYWIEYEYDEKNREVKRAEYDIDGTVNYWYEYEYDENGNQIEVVFCDGEGSVKYVYECKYSENGRKIYEKNYDSTGIAIDISEREYDENENGIKKTDTSYDGETGQKEHQTIEEYAYDEDGRKTAFYFYDNDTAASYQSRTEYDENGRLIKYTGCDKSGNILVRRETEYDISGRIIRENEYNADGNLIRYYVNEYDECGSMIRQAMYEGNVLKSEKTMSYVYRYLGNIDAEAADFLGSDAAPAEYNLKQREIFSRFLKGQEEIRYRSREDSVREGMIVRDTIKNLIHFAYYRQNKEFPEYTFLDMTGDGIEELVIRCGGNELYVIQNDHGILKVIFHTAEYDEAYLTEGNGRIGVCVSFSGYMSRNETYYFFDKKGKKEISLDVYWDSEGEKSYRAYDDVSFNWHYICEGEYYDITEMMMTEIAIEWQKLEEPGYGND